LEEKTKCQNLGNLEKRQGMNITAFSKTFRSLLVIWVCVLEELMVAILLQARMGKDAV
jgi:hypothetical protein